MQAAKLWTEHGCLIEELEKGLKELRGFAGTWEINSVNRPDTASPHRAPGDMTTNQRVHMEGPVVLVAYVGEDGLVHKWEEWPLDLRGF
jgi:hypothetical protein